MDDNNTYRSIANKLSQQKQHSNHHWLRMPNRSYAYGAAGVRGNATNLDVNENSEMVFIAYRMGYLAGLLARSRNTVVGVMISGGHNNKDDNGIKIIDSNGETLDAAWAGCAFKLLNANDGQFLTEVNNLEKNLHRSTPPIVITKVVCAYDSRKSSTELVEIVELGTKLGMDEPPFKLLHNLFSSTLPTPVLHFVLYTRDPELRKAARIVEAGADDSNRYYNHFSSAFLTLHALVADQSNPASNRKYQPLHLDCANGVGADGIKLLLKRINSNNQNNLYIKLYNETAGEAVNDKCGADFVMNFPHMPPSNFKDVPFNERCAALSGDGARVVYFFKKKGGKVVFLDGDKIALLISRFFVEHLQLLGLTDIFKVTLAQTNFSNRREMKSLSTHSGISRKIVLDGMRYSPQWESKERHCVIYFESCGLGRASFSELFFKMLEDRSNDPSTPKKQESAKLLLNMSRLMNTSGYDGMTNLLVVETILRYKNWTVKDWADAYDFKKPSIQFKIDGIPRMIASDKESSINDAVSKLLHQIRNKDEYADRRVSSTENELIRVCVNSLTPEELAREIEKTIRKITD